MKTELTTEQSQHLIKLGVPFNKASICYSTASIGNGVKGITKTEQKYIFRLTDLLKILPKYLNYEFEGVNYAANFTFRWNNRFLHYEAGYDLYDMWDKSHYCADELIDALYELACWYYDKYLKSEKK